MPVTAAALHAALLASDSATDVLERLCGAPIHIRRLTAAHLPPAPTALPPGAPIVHRAVELRCGTLVLSEADLWFSPHALPPGMVRALQETDEPFGRVVRPLGLRRRTLTARICAPDEPVSLEHRALLSTPDGVPVAEVWERYGRALVTAS